MTEQDLNTEKELLLKISEGDEKAFGVLFHRYYPRIYALVHRFSLQDHEVHEALQESFIRLWLQRDKLNEIINLQGWLLRIASRQCRDMLRKNLLLQRTSVHLQNNASPNIDGTSEKVFINEMKRLIQEAIELMPNQRRHIYQLSRKDGLSPSEIAEHLTLSVSTVKNTLTAALVHIRNHLSDAGYSVPVLFFSLFFNDNSTLLFGSPL